MLVRHDRLTMLVRHNGLKSVPLQQSLLIYFYIYQYSKMVPHDILILYKMIHFNVILSIVFFLKYTILDKIEKDIT